MFSGGGPAPRGPGFATIPPRPRYLQEMPREWLGWVVHVTLELQREGCSDPGATRRLRTGAGPPKPASEPVPCPPLSRSGKPLRSFFSSYLKSLPDVRKKSLSLPEKPSKEDNSEAVVWREFDR